MARSDMAHYGLVLASLAPIYCAIRHRFGRGRAAYRWPWCLAGYALSAVGLLIASSDHSLGTVALAVSIGLYAASTIISRQSAWLYLVAPLTPLLLWELFSRFEQFDRFSGLGLVALGLAFGGLGLLLQHGSPPRLSRPVRGLVGGYGLPFFIVAYGLDLLGLARLAGQDRSLVVLVDG